MGSIDDIMQLCRLCLVKDQVNIPIFDESSDIRQTFLKINSCLPVKVSRDDNLPKKICDGCSYKLDMLYIFRNTSVDSEKQLITWLNQAGLTSLSQAVKDGAKPEIMVKQETFETNDARIEDNPDMGADAHGELEGQHPEMGVDAHSYIIQQQKLPYQQDFAFGEPSGSTAGLIAEEPAPKRAKRAASVKKHVPLETEEDELVEAAMQITKAEEEDSDDIDQPEYVEAPSTSADDQPGPSGVGKGTIEAPSASNHFLIILKPSLSLPLELNKQIPSGAEIPVPPLVPIGSETSPTDSKEFIPIGLPLPEPAPEFICQTCNRKYPSKTQWSKHQRVHKEKIYDCDLCSMKFRTPYMVKHHKMHRHAEEKNQVCSVCSKRFTTAHRLKMHMVVHTRNYRYKCDKCDSGYGCQKTLRNHMMTAHDDFRFVCEICKRMFKYEPSYKAHVKSHEPDHVKKTWPCKLCLKVFHNRNSLKRHTKIHEGEVEKNVCEVCGKCYASSNFLSHHMKTHTGQKSYICEVCGKGFIMLKMLKEHMRVHTKEKPFVCPVCGKGFTQKGSLNIHLRIHTGERPYKCKICSKGFLTGNLLKTHTCSFK